MRAVDSIVERRIRDARAAGYFDNLPGAGKPIADIDRQRPPGWWANRLVKTERIKLKALRLEEELATAMPPLWRLECESDVRDRAAELNARIDRYNRTTTIDEHALLDVERVVAEWQRLRTT